MHHIDRRTPWDEIWEAMEVLRSQGKILYVGSSNFAGWHIAKSAGRGAPTVALAWLFTRPAVTAPIIGPRTIEQFEGSLRSLEITLDEQTLTQLDTIFPGHRPAPEDYAW
jgi:aryl-alcohol dehydrogenase-like predicted oxidoreductase